MIANLLIVAFLLAMIYWWGLQGFFSAFLHLIVTIVAASIAVALWEPLVMGFLLGRMPAYAWCVGLLGPFILLHLGLRTALDFLVPRNVQFTSLINMIAGGALGLFTALFIAGIAFIGTSYLPLGPELGGVEPYAVDGSGEVVETDHQLWIRVDHFAEGLLDRLSAGAFSSGHELAVYRPYLSEMAVMYRLRYDLNASLSAHPDSVRVDRAARANAPIDELDASVRDAIHAIAPRGRQVYIFDTVWESMPGVYDQGTLYLPPTQIRLVAERSELGRTITELHAPVAFSREINPQTGTREFQLINNSTVQAYGTTQRERIGWMFVLTPDHTPRFLIARQLRLPLPDPIQLGGEQVAAMVGFMPTAASSDTVADGQQPTVAEGDIGPRTGVAAGAQPVQIEVNAALPLAFSRNQDTRPQYQDNGVLSGASRLDRPTGSIPAGLRIDRVWAPQHQRVVRVRLAQDRAQSLLGATRVQAASLGAPWIRDDRGQQWSAIGFALNRGGALQFNINRDVPIRSAREIPAFEMQPGEELYLYFVLNPGVTVVQFGIGSTTFDVNVPVN